MELNLMENKDIYFGRGTAEMFDDYMDFINYVFGFNFIVKGVGCASVEIHAI